ncbi:DUF4234 domain-containing protein [Gordonia sp. L191]|uniref:DUF4234 domain-containing protein n=1 Tax=Gordonia sp. L191 TaxID=2982699 RepID=UPI0024C07E59|nr:DUF4234 domain-containing protein [Gordonia sp. L191]WHU47204.1 DUF4234 domain-containing protein [Gordonia sp. L191]
MSTPQQPGNDHNQPGPSNAPTTHYQKQSPGPDGQRTTAYQRPPAPRPTEAPTRVHARPQVAQPAGPPRHIAPTAQPGIAQPGMGQSQVPPGRPGPPARSDAQPPAPGGQVPTGRPVADGAAMKKRNPIAVWIGLPLITLGIYSLVWYYKINKEIAAFDRRKEISAVGPLLVIIFLGWTVIAPIISFHNTGKRIREAQRSAGLPETCNPLLCWVLGFVFGLHTFYMQSELNKIVDRYGAEPGTTVPLFA